LGSPDETSWPGFSDLPNAKTINFIKQPKCNLSQKFPYLGEMGMDLLKSLLCYNPVAFI
jgi:hypothetical protein